MSEQLQEHLKKQSAFSRAVHSIRTRYALATACVMLLVLGMFYVGGRIVLVHFVRDAEGQVQDIGFNIARLINREGERTCETAAALARLLAEDSARTPAEALARLPHAHAAFAVRLDAAGRLLPGAAPLAAADLAPYAESLAVWRRRGLDESRRARGIGILRLRARSFYCALAALPDGHCVLVGEPFDTALFTARVNATLSGMEVRVAQEDATRRRPRARAAREAADPPRRNAFGLVPMVTEALNFYSGGFWEFNSHPLEAAFTIRDVAGKPLALVAVSLPRTFSSVTASALGRLTFFIAVIGLLLIGPIFWFQNHILLNPLSRMIARTKEIGERHSAIDCPRVEWEGDDEFAQLAVSLNRMLETISRRSLAVAQSESRQRALISGVPDGLAIFDRVGRLVSVVKMPEGVGPLPGCGEGALLDPAVWGGESLRAFTTLLASIFHTGEVGALALTARLPDGACRHCEFRLSRMDAHFALAVVRDVTEELAERQRRRRAEERLARVGKHESMALFAAGIAHDVNNVLATVVNTVETSFRDVQDAALNASLDSIRDAVGRGRDMMRELQTFAGEAKIALKRTTPHAIVAGVRRLLENAAGANVPLVCEVGEDLPAVDADPNQIWKVFFNLVKNAAEAMGTRPGRITITARPYAMTHEASVDFHAGRPIPSGAGVLFDVRDEGPGMPPDLLKRIFDPYVSSKNVGRGLGLAIVSAIVDAHGGGIAVETVLDRGTVFHVYLPVSRLPTEERPAPSPQATPRGGTGDVLVVDDDAAIRATTAILLKSLGYTAHAAQDNHEAMDVFRRLSDTLACVLLDAHLGDTDAVRLLGQFRSTNPHVRVVVVSGSARETVGALFANAPFDGFLAKPYTRGELAAALSAT